MIIGSLTSLINIVLPVPLLVSFAITAWSIISAFITYTKTKDTWDRHDSDKLLILSNAFLFFFLLPFAWFISGYFQFLDSENSPFDELFALLALISPFILCVLSPYLFNYFLADKLGKQKRFMLFGLSPTIFLIFVGIWGILGYVQTPLMPVGPCGDVCITSTVVQPLP